MQITSRKSQPLLGPDDSIGDLMHRARFRLVRRAPPQAQANSIGARYRAATVWAAGVSLAVVITPGFVDETNLAILAVVVLVGILGAMVTLISATLVRRRVTAAVIGGAMGFFVAMVFTALYEPMCTAAVLVAPLLSCLGLLIGDSSEEGA